MRDVVVLGGGLHKFGRWPDKSIEDLGRVAIAEAIEDSEVGFKDIQIAFCGRVYQGMGAGLRVVTELGQTGIPIINVEQACSSSSTAFRLAYWAIGAGIYDVALVVGFEKMERGLIQTTTSGSYDQIMGLAVMPASYAMKANRYIKAYGATREMFAQVSVKSHRNGALNPNAQYQTPITLEEVLNSRMIADPITLLQCSPTTDGASAIVLCAKKKAAQFSLRGINVAGWSCGTAAYTPRGKGDAAGDDELVDGTVERLAAECYERAGVGPEDVDVCQVHDAFTPGEIVQIEALGLVKVGEGARFVWEGETEIVGKIPVNTDGGLLSRGHPVGATGAAQIIEVFRQLRGEGGPRQVPNNPKVGLCHNSGIGGVNIHVFTK